MAILLPTKVVASAGGKLTTRRKLALRAKAGRAQVGGVRIRVLLWDHGIFLSPSFLFYVNASLLWRCFAALVS